MRNALIALSAGCLAIVVGAVSSAEAAPAEASDLTGKRICWSNGGKDTFGAGGVYSSTGAGDGAWSISGGTVTITASRLSFEASVEKMPGGAFRATFLSGRRRFQTVTGSPCR